LLIFATFLVLVAVEMEWAVSGVTELDDDEQQHVSIIAKMASANWLIWLQHVLY
jgi:hypothetical protein